MPNRSESSVKWTVRVELLLGDVFRVVSGRVQPRFVAAALVVAIRTEPRGVADRALAGRAAPAVDEVHAEPPADQDVSVGAHPGVGAVDAHLGAEVEHARQ